MKMKVRVGRGRRKHNFGRKERGAGSMYAAHKCCPCMLQAAQDSNLMHLVQPLLSSLSLRPLDV